MDQASSSKEEADFLVSPKRGNYEQGFLLCVGQIINNL